MVERMKSYNNYIKIFKKDKKAPNASIILENHEEPIIIKLESQKLGKGRTYEGSKAQKPELIIKHELINRFIRDILTI